MSPMLQHAATWKSSCLTTTYKQACKCSLVPNFISFYYIFSIFFSLLRVFFSNISTLLTGYYPRRLLLLYYADVWVWRDIPRVSGDASCVATPSAGGVDAAQARRGLPCVGHRHRVGRVLRASHLPHPHAGQRQAQVGTGGPGAEGLPANVSILLG